jgi:trans-2,3-dihydro-3-hydroxyanthranilate isomerase
MPEAVSCGVPFLFIPLKNRDAVRRASVRLDLFNAALADYTTSKVMIFAMDPELDGHDVRARMFAPSIGVPEDPATGSACSGLSGYLAARDPRRDGTLRWVVEQGFEMGRPSILELEADKKDGAITAVRVGGSTVMVCEGTFSL